MNYSKNANDTQHRSRKQVTKKASNFVGVMLVRIFLIAFIIGVFAVIGGGVGIYLGILKNSPVLTEIEIVPEAYTTIIYEDGTGNEIDRLHGEENREYVKLDKIPIYMQNACVSIEDERFYSHNGIDIKGMFRALYSNIQSRELSEGASTITQQLIKLNLLKDTSKNFTRKLQEQFLAVRFEEMLIEKLKSKKAAKDYILEVYLNTIPLGHGYNGVQAAAKGYFDKNVEDLTLAESAAIVSITQNPSWWSPVSFPENNKIRQTNVLNNMLKFEMITQRQYDEAIAEDIYANVSRIKGERAEEGSSHSYFTDQLITELARDFTIQKGITLNQAYNLIYNGGLQIYATIDMEMQKIVDDTYHDDSLFPSKIQKVDYDFYFSAKDNDTGVIQHYRRFQSVYSEEEGDAFVQSVRDEMIISNQTMVKEDVVKTIQPQSSFALIDHHSGQVKAFAGGRGEKPTLGRPLNRATQSVRQPGSAFKVLAAYAPALDMGKITASTMILDEPYKVDNKEYKNWYGSYRGLNSVRVGIQESMNILAVKTLVEITGIDTAYNYLVNFGFSSLVERDERNGMIFSDKTSALALGGLTDGVSTLELAAAYGTIANKGEYIKPVFYSKVLDHDGNVILENTPQPKTVLKETTAFILTDMMKDVITKGTGGAAAFKNVKIPIAGKTGTTSETIDMVFAGYTPYYTAAIWLGYDIPQEMTDTKNAAGESYHLALWSRIMEQIHQDLEYRDFEIPPGVVTKTVCSISGRIYNDNLCSIVGAKKTSDYFAVGTEPTELCNNHTLIKVCTVSDKLAINDCPTETVTLVWEGSYNSKNPKPTGHCDVHAPIVVPEPEPGEEELYIPEIEIDIPEVPEVLEVPEVPEVPDEPIIDENSSSTEIDEPIIIDNFDYPQD